MFYRSWIRPTTLKITECYGDNHWETFVECRKKHNDNLCEETNKLVLRLDKLMSILEDGQQIKDIKPTDLNKSIDIEWTPDDLVKLCPYCAKSFTFARRRHHCRLCGAILCNSCSGFLEYKKACTLVKPAKLYNDLYDRIEDQIQNSSHEEKPKIRLCEDCKRLLDKRLQTIEDHYCQPTYLDLYEKLRKKMAEADNLLLSQSSLSTQTNPKETALELKSKIQDLRQIIAGMAAKIKRLSEKETNFKQAFLLKAINQTVVHWLGESIESKADRVYGVVAQLSRSGRSTGWVPEQPSCPSSSISEEENPLLIQIKNLEEYIKQAKLADRYEEISALEASKRDLEIEYFIQQDLASINLNESTTASPVGEDSVSVTATNSAEIDNIMKQ